MCAGDIMPIPK